MKLNVSLRANPRILSHTQNIDDNLDYELDGLIKS